VIQHNGTAPLPVWSGNSERHRLSRTGNRQLNAAIHRIALTQARYHPDAIVFIKRRTENGDSGQEALRALKRRLWRRRPPCNARRHISRPGPNPFGRLT
jgi:transposase